MSVIVAGSVHVDPADRDRFVEGSRPVVVAARNHAGCLDIAISPDPIEPDRVNIYEYWESREALDAFRAAAPQPSESVDIKDDRMFKHEVSHTGPPFD